VARSVLAALLAAVALMGCTGGAPAGARLPSAEFLVAAGDSTFWVRSSGEGMRVRSAPILLTQADGRTFELFLSDEGAEYADASFATMRLWARDLAGPDSVALVADSTVLRELARWRRRHPREPEVDPTDETLTEDPATVVTDAVEILEVHGPYVSVEQLLDVDVAGGAPHVHAGRRFVVDVRTGARVPLASLVGEGEAARVLGVARQSLARLADSIRVAAAAGDERAQAAADVLASFRFDSTGFGITDVARQPALAFLVPGTGDEGEALALPLPPIPVAPPAWWGGVRGTLPVWAADSSRLDWNQPGYQVVARPTDDGEAVALALQGTEARSAPAWPVATVPVPVYQFLQLDAPPLTGAARQALSRAFDQSTAGGLVERARWRGGAAPAAAPWLRHASRRVDGGRGASIGGP
jgi:hypothetical protein